MEEINLKDLCGYMKKYIWLICVIAVLFLAIVVVYDKEVKMPMYRADTTLVLTKVNNNVAGTITQTDITINQNLVSTYSKIVKSKLVLSKAIKNLGLKYNVKELSDNVSVEAVQDTEMLKISVINADAVLARDIANEIAKVFTLEVTKMYQVNNISVVDKAETPKDVCNNTLKRDVVLAIFGAFALCFGVLFIIYYFDDSVKDSEDLENIVGMPILARVLQSDVVTKNKKMKPELLVEKYPKSLVSESIKMLRTNLQFSAIDNDIKKILVTSSVAGEGKSFISANLAISFTQVGKRVLLIDCDMRKGRLHKIFRVPNTKGFSNLLIDDITNIGEYVKKTNVVGLSLITRGDVPPNPSELLNSRNNKILACELIKYFDVIIYDGVPCNGLPDSIIMSKLVDQVVIVCNNGITPKTMLNNAKISLQRVDAPVSGIILNNVSIKNSYGKYYDYYGRDNE